MHKDEQYMLRCLQLAALGQGNVAPNPMVGCVIVHNNNIIAEGYHQKYGGSHAEVNAINNVKDKEILQECTIYVSLEPCSHHGKTPPCANLIVKHRFKEVVIGSVDPNEKVAGKGIQLIKNAGIKVKTGVLETECLLLNKAFITFHTKKRPYVLLKWAQTTNGFIDNNGKEAAISCEETRPFVHQLRDQYQSILVGRKTVEIDDPELTVRAIKGSNPTRIVLDSLNRLERNRKVFNDQAETIVFNLEKDAVHGNVKHIRLNTIDIKSILEMMYSLSIVSVMVEGGSQTIQSFINSGLWDESIVIVGEPYFESGTQAPHIDKQPVKEVKNYSDFILTYYN